jgi:hypothetical protein
VHDGADEELAMIRELHDEDDRRSQDKTEQKIIQIKKTKSKRVVAIK